jgi:hypothetical protein
MASSENQGLQIALIIFVILTILLSVTTFMFFREYEDASNRAKAATAKSQTDDTAARAAEADVGELKKLVGVNAAASLADVRTQFEKDMKDFAGTVPEESRFYRPALEFLSGTNKKHEEDLVDARADIQREKDSRATVEAAKETQVKAAEQKVEEAEKALTDAKQAFDAERKQMLADNEDLKTQLAKKNQDMADLEEKSKQQIELATKENVKLAQTNTILVARTEELDPTIGTEVPDGVLVGVDQKLRRAYINVGSADGLHRQTLFSVVSSDEDVGGNQRTKGRIEVTDILGPHQAVARIIQDQMTDPMVQGEKIYTPLWQPGRVEAFGIVGKIDVDGDRLDDRQLIKDLIRHAGARVDAEDDPTFKTGKQTGELTLNTRYLIVGEGSEEREVVEGAYTKLQNDARRLGVRILPVADFLDEVGWKNPKNVLVFGRGGNADDVPPTMPDGGRRISSGNTSGSFKVRRPPGRRGIGSTQPSAGTATEKPNKTKPKSAYGK